jgi:hypothetical protein
MTTVLPDAYVDTAASGMIASMAHYGNRCPAVGDGRVSTPAWYANRLGKVLLDRGDQLPGSAADWWGTRWLAYAQQLAGQSDTL